MYVYIRSESELWTVGFYTPDGIWKSESDYSSKQEASERVAFLNGGKNYDAEIKNIYDRLYDLDCKQ